MPVIRSDRAWFSANDIENATDPRAIVELLQAEVAEILATAMHSKLILELNADLKSASHHLEANETNIACIDFLRIGRTLSDMRLSELRQQLKRLQQSRNKQLAPLSAKRELDFLVRNAAQTIATTLWELDQESRLRIHDVLPEVLELVTIVTDKLGIKIYSEITIRRWVKEIAPPYASIPGRPKKK